MVHAQSFISAPLPDRTYSNPFISADQLHLSCYQKRTGRALVVSSNLGGLDMYAVCGNFGVSIPLGRRSHHDARRVLKPKSILCPRNKTRRQDSLAKNRKQRPPNVHTNFRLLMTRYPLKRFEAVEACLNARDPGSRDV